MKLKHITSLPFLYIFSRDVVYDIVDSMSVKDVLIWFCIWTLLLSGMQIIMKIVVDLANYGSTDIVDYLVISQEFRRYDIFTLVRMVSPYHPLLLLLRHLALLGIVSAAIHFFIRLLGGLGSFQDTLKICAVAFSPFFIFGWLRVVVGIAVPTGGTFIFNTILHIYTLFVASKYLARAHEMQRVDVLLSIAILVFMVIIAVSSVKMIIEEGPSPGLLTFIEYVRESFKMLASPIYIGG